VLSPRSFPLFQTLRRIFHPVLPRTLLPSPRLSVHPPQSPSRPSQTHHLQSLLLSNSHSSTSVAPPSVPARPALHSPPIPAQSYTTTKTAARNSTSTTMIWYPHPHRHPLYTPSLTPMPATAPRPPALNSSSSVPMHSRRHTVTLSSHITPSCPSLPVPRLEKTSLHTRLGENS
jgi:hypothetical protein